MTLERQVTGDFMQSITAEENIKPLKIIRVITWVKLLGQKSKNVIVYQYV